MGDRERWAVVGGGILGLTLAHRLAQAGHGVTLFEAAERLGGLAAAWELDGVVWDRHYHVTLLSDRHLRALWAELGLASELRWTETRTGFYTGGRLHSLSNSLEFLRFPPLRLGDKLRLAATILHASRIKDPLPLEAIPVADWLRRWSGERTFETIWLPLLKAKLGEHYRQTSAAFLWATIARMYAARRTGLKKEMFGYVPGGYARILERFAATLAAEGVEIRTGCAVRRIAREPGEKGIRVELRNGHGGPGENTATFDQVVATLSAPAAARICEGLTADESARLRSIQYLGIVCASLLLRQPLAGFYVTNITDPGIPFTAMVEMSTLVDPDELGGHTLVYLPKYLDPDDPMFALSDGEIEETFLAALERMIPSFDRGDLLCFRVSRVRQVFALPTLHYSRGLPPMSTSVPGLHLVSSAHIVHGTLNVDETIQLANRAAARLAATSRQARR
ncbi:MAG TPA: NAD(P)/FAD-dependent oxidoreductase [Thermoanaerobaculia bacterium]|jgi:protoporphyrinogen oxidase|nr:NAD(P)/FAD-dependent oxidoreductase [Thermoanaerobaculia bacterium]